MRTSPRAGIQRRGEDRAPVCVPRGARHGCAAGGHRAAEEAQPARPRPGQQHEEDGGLPAEHGQDAGGGAGSTAHVALERLVPS